MSNVRVAVRVRPLNRRELGQDERFVVSLSGDAIQIENLKVGGGHDFVDSRERVKRFTFDYCYNSAVEPESPDYAGQELIFQDLGTEVLQAAFEGYNACVFAYGQTGSGKTYTMMGQDPEEVGLTPRICEGLFARVDDFLEADDISFRVDISYLEIYNERVRDLLHSRKADKYTLKVREHPKQGPYVQDLSHHLVKNNAEIQSLLYRGNESRTTAVTHMHEHSSRSHAIITVTFTQARLEDDMPSEIVSKLHLVDLAGSERADKTCKTNYKGRLKEGANINKSLTTLGNVIKALAEKSILSMSIESLASSHSVYSSSGGDSQTSPASSPKKQRTFHIPYRDSVLTWLLKDSLGGNSKTIMIATVSPGSCHYSESLSTLRYAQRAQDIINEPKVNEDCSVTLIRELKREIERLRQMLCTAQMMNSLIPIKDTGGNFIVEKLQENEARANELTQSWIEKWHETHDILSESDVHIRRPLGRRTSSQGVIVDSELPHLIGVDDDILSTGITLYYLKDGKTRIGREDACRLQDIVLHGPCIMREHCIIRNVLGTVTLYPNKGALCSVNGIYVKEPTRLTQGNTILLGKTHMFRFNHPKEAAQLREHRKKLHSCGSLTSNSSDDIQHSHLNASASSLSPMSLLSRSAELDRTYSTDPERIAQAQCEIKHIHEQESTTDQLCYEKQREIETLHAKHLNDLEQQRHHLAKLIDERQEERIKDEEQLDEAKRELEKERLQNQQQLDQELDQLQWFRHNRRFQETTTQTDNSTCTTSSTNTSITQVDETDGCSSDVFKETEELVQKKLSLEGHLKSLAQQELVRELRLRHIEENIARQEEKLEKHFDETQDQITQQTGVIRQLEDSYQHDESRISVDMAKQLRQLESLQKKEERLELYIEEKVDLLSVEMALPHPLREAISYEYLTSADIALADSVNHLSERRGSDGDLPSTGHMYAVPSSSCLSTASSMDSLTSSVESVSAFSRTDSPNSQPSDLSSSTHTSPKYCITQKAQSVTDRLYRPPPLSQRSHSTSDVNSGANQKRGATTPLLRYSLRKRPSRKHKDIESPVSKLEKTNTPVKHAKVGLNTKISFSKTPQISRTSSLASVPEAVEDAGNLQQFMPTIPVVLRTRRRRLTDEEESRRHSAPVGDKLASALELYTDEMNNAGSLVSLSDGQHFTDSLDPVSSLVWTSHIGKPISVDDNVYRRPKCSDGENVFSEWQSSDTLNPLLSTNKATKNLIIPIITVTDESSCAHNNHTIHISDQTDSVSQDLHETGSSPVFNVPGMDDETVTNHITANSCLDNRLNVDSDSIVHKISDNDDEAEEYFSADSLNDCEISNRSHKDAFSNQILSTSQLCDQIEADNDIVYIAETAQSTDKEYLAASISLYRQNDCETTDKFDILTCTNVSIETEPQENIPTPLSVLSKENTNIEMNPTYSEFLENQELTWTSEMTNHDPGDDQFMRLSNSDIVPDATSNSELAPAGTKSRNGDEEEKEEEEEEEHKRKMDDEFSADSLQETEEQSKTQTTVNRRMAKQLRQKNGARQQHPRWTEVENADLLSDDSLASGHNSHNSRPNLGAKRRRRPVAKLSASNAIKKRRDNSSEECTSSDNDSIFSDDSLTYADNKEDTLQASSICDRTLRSTVIDNDVMTNTDSQSLIRTFVSVTESVDMLTNALQDDIPDDDLSQSNLKSKDLSPLADINQSIDDSSSEATGVVENDVLETSGSFSVANFHEPTFRLVTSDTSIASAVSQSKLQRLALSNINVVSTEDMSKTNQDSEREMPRSVIYAKHNDILEAKHEVCDMIVEQAEPLSSTSPVQLQLVSNEVEVNVEYNMQRIEYNAQGLIKRNVNDDQAILPIQLTTSALPERIEIILTETKTVKVEERHVSERKEQLCIHGYDDNGVAILESLIKEQNFHTSIESLHEIITENGRVSRENSSERVLEDQDSKHYHLPAFDQENHVFNGSCEGNAKSAIEPETSIKQSGSVNIDICSEESLIQCPNCVSDHFVSNSGDSSKSSTANNDFNDLDNASKGCCESIAGVPDTDFHPANRHSFNVISSDSDILHKHTDTHSFMPHFANDLDGHVVSESGDSGYSDSVKHDDDSISSKYKNLTTHILLNNSDYNATKNRCDCIVFGDTLNAIQPRVIAYEENMSAAEQPSEHRRLAIINIVSQEAVFVPRFENSSIDNILVQSVPVIVSEKMDVSQDELIIFKALPGIHQGPVTFNVGGIQKQNEVIPDEVIPESDFASKNPELRAQTDIYTNQFQESTECMSPQISNSHSFQDHKVLSDSSSGAELKYDCVKILTEKIPSVYSMPDTVANALLFPDNDSKVEEISTLDHIGGIQSRSTSTELYNSDLQTSGDAIVKDGNVISCDAVPLQHVSNSIDNVQEISERLPGMYDLPLCHFHDQTACPVNGNALTVLDKVDGCILGNDVSSESSLKFASGTPSSSEIQEHIRRVLDSQLSHLQQQTRSLSDSAISSDYTDGESANVSPRSSRMQDVGKVGGEASNVANRLTWPPTNRDTVHGNLPGTDLYEHDQNCIVAGFEGFCMNKQTGMVYGNESLHTVDILDNERMLNVNDAADIYSRECGNVNDNGRQTVTDNAPSNGSRTETNVDCDKHSNKGYSDDNESDQSDGQDPIPPRLATERFSGGNSTNMDGVYFSTLVNIPVVDGRQLQFPDIEGDSSLSLEHEPVCNAPSLSDLTDDGRHIQKWGSADSVVITMYESQPAKRTKCTKEKSKLIASQKELTETDHLSQNRLFVLFSGNGQNAVSSPAILVDSIQDLDHEYVSTVSQSVGTVEDNLCIDTREECLEVNPPIYSGGDRHQEQTKSGREKSPSLPDMISEVVHQLRQSSVSAEELHLSDTDDLNTADSSDSITFIFLNGSTTPVKQGLKEDGSKHSVYTPTTVDHNHSGEEHVVHMRHKYGINSQILPLSERTVSSDNLPKLSQKDTVKRRHSSADFSRSKPYSQVTNDQEAFPPFADDRTDGSEVEIDNELQPLAAKQYSEQFDDAEATFPSCFAETIEVSQAEVTNLEDEEISFYIDTPTNVSQADASFEMLDHTSTSTKIGLRSPDSDRGSSFVSSAVFPEVFTSLEASPISPHEFVDWETVPHPVENSSIHQTDFLMTDIPASDSKDEQPDSSASTDTSGLCMSHDNSFLLSSLQERRPFLEFSLPFVTSLDRSPTSPRHIYRRFLDACVGTDFQVRDSQMQTNNHILMATEAEVESWIPGSMDLVERGTTMEHDLSCMTVSRGVDTMTTHLSSATQTSNLTGISVGSLSPGEVASPRHLSRSQSFSSLERISGQDRRNPEPIGFNSELQTLSALMLETSNLLKAVHDRLPGQHGIHQETEIQTVKVKDFLTQTSSSLTDLHSVDVQTDELDESEILTLNTDLSVSDVNSLSIESASQLFSSMYVQTDRDVLHRTDAETQTDLSAILVPLRSMVQTQYSVTETSSIDPINLNDFPEQMVDDILPDTGLLKDGSLIEDHCEAEINVITEFQTRSPDSTDRIENGEMDAKYNTGNVITGDQQLNTNLHSIETPEISYNRDMVEYEDNNFRQQRAVNESTETLDYDAEDMAVVKFSDGYDNKSSYEHGQNKNDAGERQDVLQVSHPVQLIDIPKYGFDTAVEPAERDMTACDADDTSSFHYSIETLLRKSDKLSQTNPDMADLVKLILSRQQSDNDTGSSSSICSTDFQSDIDKLQREGLEILELLSLNYLPSSLTVELLEAKLNYCIGQTDLLLASLEDTDSDSDETNKQHGANVVEVVSVSMSNDNKEKRSNDRVVKSVAITCTSEEVHSNTIPVTVNDSRDNRSVTTTSKSTTNTESQPDHADDVLIENSLEVLEKSRKHISNANLGEAAKEPHGNGRGRTLVRNWDLLAAKKRAEMEAFRLERMREQNEYLRKSLSPLKNTETATSTHTQSGAVNDISPLVMTPHQHKDHMVQLRQSLVKKVVEEDHQRSQSPNRSLPRSRSRSSTSSRPVTLSRETSPDINPADYLYRFNEILFGPESNYCAQNNPLSDHSSGETGIRYASNRRHSVSDGISADVKSTSLDRTLSITDYSKRIQNLSISVAAPDATMQPGNRIDHCGAMKSSQMHARSWSAEDSSRRVSPGGYGALASHPSPLNTSLALNSPRGSYEMYANSFVRDCQETHSRAVEAISAAKEALYRRPSISNSIQHNSFFVPSSIERIKRAETHSVSPRRDISNKAIDHEIDELRRQLKNRYPSLSSPRQKYTSASTATYRESISRRPVSYDSFASYTSPRNRNVRSYDSSPSSYSAYANGLIDRSENTIHNLTQRHSHSTGAHDRLDRTTLASTRHYHDSYANTIAGMSNSTSTNNRHDKTHLSSYGSTRYSGNIRTPKAFSRMVRAYNGGSQF